MTDRAIGEVLLDEANRRLLANLRLFDWRKFDGNDKALAASLDDRPHKVKVAVNEERIDITFHDPDGKVIGSLWLEIEGQKFVVHAYDKEHDEPVNLHINRDHILVDTHDRDMNT